MKFETHIEGNTRSVEIDEHGGRFTVTVDGRCYEADIVQPEPGLLTFYIGDRIVEVHVAESAGENAYRVQAGNRVIEVQVIDRKHRHASAEVGVEGTQTLTAPMPGRVVDVLVSVGDAVERGQGILVVEAMKMQNEVKSPKDGVVKDIRTAVGDAVNAGQVLAVVE